MNENANTYRRTADYRQLRVRPSATVDELVTAVVRFENFSGDEETTWRVEGDTLVLECPLGEQLVPEGEGKP